MSKVKEKAAEVLEAPGSGWRTNMQFQILEKTPNVFKPSAKQFETLRAEFAILGMSLSRSYRAVDGSINYVVSSHLGARYFSHWHDVLACRTSLQWAVTK